MIARDIDAILYDEEAIRMLRAKLEAKTVACERLSFAAACGWCVIAIFIALWLIGRCS